MNESAVLKYIEHDTIQQNALLECIYIGKN